MASILTDNTYKVTDKIILHIPTLREIIAVGEELYYSTLALITATPWDYKVQLHEMGIRFEDVNNYDFFIMMFQHWQNDNNIGLYFHESMTFKDLVLGVNKLNNEAVITDKTGSVIFDRLSYSKTIKALCKMHFIHKEHGALKGDREWLMKTYKKKQERMASKEYENILEGLIIAMVNTPEFPYNYESALDLNIYLFNSSVQQIQRRIIYDKVMSGIYVGMIDTKKMDKSILNWTSPLKI